MLNQSSHHPRGKQVGSALWELNGNHPSHHEPVLWDRDVCWGESELFHKLFVSANRYSPSHLLTLPLRCTHITRCHFHADIYALCLAHKFLFSETTSADFSHSSVLQRTWKTFQSCSTMHRRRFFTPLPLFMTLRTNRSAIFGNERPTVQSAPSSVQVHLFTCVYKVFV